MAHQYINPPDVLQPRNDAYTLVVVSTGTKQVHLAGVTGNDRDGNIADNMASQVRTACESIVKMLAAAGATTADVVNRVTFVTDIDLYFKEGAEVTNEFFPARKRPCGTLIEISRLASPKAMVEIECVAVID